MKRLFTSLIGLLALVLLPNLSANAQCVSASEPYPITFDENNPVTFTCTVPDVLITDVTLALNITHTWIGDIQLTVTPPAAPAVLLFEDLSNTTGECAENNMRITLTAAGTDGDITDCNTGPGGGDGYIDGGTYTTVGDDGVDIGAVFDGGIGLAFQDKPRTTDLRVFRGQASLGAWTLDFIDDAAGDVGTIDSAPILVVTGTQLPVEMVSFEGLFEDDAIVLNWETATELNNAGFEVEHAIRNGEFQSVGYVAGAGTISEAQSYTFKIDDVEFGNQSFRLKQIDFDGTAVYSEVLELTRELVDGYLLEDAYPNPFNPQTQFNLLVAEDQQIDVGVYNIQGQRVATIFNGLLGGQQWHKMTFNSGSLTSGTYLIHSVGQGFLDTQKVILMK